MKKWIKEKTKFLWLTDQGPLIYTLKAGLLALLISVPISAIVTLSFFDPDTTNKPAEGSLIFLLATVFIAPIVENALLVLLISLLLKLIKKDIAIISLSALIFAIWHSLVRPLWGLSVFSSFYIMSISYLTWKKQGKLKAYIVSVGIHFIINLAATAMMLLSML